MTVVAGTGGLETPVVRAQVGTRPALPATVRVLAADGSSSTQAVTWDALPAQADSIAGTYTVSGSGGASAIVDVFSVAGVDGYSTATGAGDVPTLPSYLNVRYSDGSSVLRPVTWGSVDPSALVAGATVRVPGTIAGVPAAQQPVATIRVVAPVSGNLARQAVASVSYTTVNASPATMIDGVTDTGGWTNQSGSAASADGGDWASLTWKAPQLVKSLNVYFTVSATRSTPSSIEVDRWDGRDWVAVGVQPVTYSQSSTTPTTITFAAPVSTSKLRLRMASSAPLTATGWVQIQELQAIGDVIALSSNAALSDLKVNGVSIFDPAKTAYDVASKVYPPVIMGTAADNGTVAVTLPASLPGVATVVVTSEDGTTTKTYTVNITDTLVSGGVGGSVPATLSLSLGAPAAFGPFTAGVAKDYTATTTANVISTAGDATLSVADPSSVATGHLVNGTFSLPSPLGGLGVVKTWSAPVSNDPVTVTFTQHIGATDALRTGAYSKTLTFTLSTTNP